MPEGFHHKHKSKGVAVATDLDDSGSPGVYDLPSPSTAGALAAPVVAKGKDGKPLANADAPTDGDEYARWVERTGWAPRFGNGQAGEVVEADSLADHQTWVESKLDDKFFGGRFTCIASRGIR